MKTVFIVLMVLLVLAIVFVFLKEKTPKPEGFADTSQAGLQDWAVSTQYGASVFNKFGAHTDIMRPNFVQSTAPQDVAAGTALIQKATVTSSMAPGGNYSKQQSVLTPTNLQLPLKSASIEAAKKCAKLTGTSSCDSLGTPEYADCGVCIRGGKDYTGNVSNYIGGLYLNPDDRADLDAARRPYVPTLGQCNPLNGNQMFFTDRDTCKREANRQACREVTDFTSPGADKCIKATGNNTFIHEPAKGKKFNATLRFAAPNGVTTKVTIFPATAPIWPVVQVFTDVNFEGQSAMRGAGSYMGPTMGVPNDSIQSIQVGAGARIQSYEHGFSGNDRMDSSSQADLNSLSMKSNTSWANQISSYTVSFTTSPLGQATASNGAEGRIILQNVTEGTSLYVLVEQDDVAVYQGESRRGFLAQWEMEGSATRRVEFNRSVTATVTNGTTTQGTKLLRKFGSKAGGKQMVASNASNISGNAIWVWNNKQQHEVAGFMSFVPGFYSNPYYTQDNTAAGGAPLIGLASTAAALQVGPCMAAGQVPGKYSQACLVNLIQGVGGDPVNGKLAKSGLTNLNKQNGVDQSVDDISDYLDSLYTIATTGKNNSGVKQTMAQINDASQKMFGFDIGSPCEDINESDAGFLSIVPKKAPIDADCLNYLWLNTGNSRDRGNEDRSRKTKLYNTYQSIQDRYSGLRDGEGTPEARQATPFNACNSKGILAPKNSQGALNYGAISEVNKLVKSVPQAQDYYNQIYKTANYTSGNGDKDDVNTQQQAKALQQCYGVSKTPDSSCSS